MATQQFHDFLNNGCQVRLAVALDFTGWHVDSRQRQRRRVPPTPHSSPADTRKGTGGEWDDYEQAILTVGSILAQLDPDHARIPVWGFGAKYNHIVRACFQCDPKYKVEGTQGIIKAFRGVLQNPKCMSYQSKFTNVISMAANYARHEQDVAREDGKESYTILAIFTDRDVQQLEPILKQLKAAKRDPLSVVYVCIGEGDFSGIELLSTLVDYRTTIVRFHDSMNDTRLLTSTVMDHVPDQLLQYYHQNDLLPKARKEIAFSLVVPTKTEKEEEFNDDDSYFHYLYDDNVGQGPEQERKIRRVLGIRENADDDDIYDSFFGYVFDDPKEGKPLHGIKENSEDVDDDDDNFDGYSILGFSLGPGPKEGKSLHGIKENSEDDDDDDDNFDDAYSILGFSMCTAPTTASSVTP